MIRTIAALAVAAAVLSPAYADDITIAPAFVGSRSVAEVQAELVQFKASGIDPWAHDYDQRHGFQSVATREEVSAEYLATRLQAAARHGEDSGSGQLAAMPARSAGTLAGMSR